MPSLILCSKTKMVVVWSPCSLLLSLLLCLLFFFTSSTANARPLSAMVHHDGRASRKDLICHQNVKVTKMLTSNFTTTTVNKPKERPSRVIDNESMSKQASEEQIIVPTSSHKNKIAKKCDFAAKVSSKSISSTKHFTENKGHERRLRKRLPRQRDMDSFVAYADYRGPVHHPPKNN